MQIREFELKQKSNLRLDIFLASQIAESRSTIQKLIKLGLVRINGIPAKASMGLKAGDKIIIELPIPERVEAVAEDIPLEILFEDSEIAVINKRAGMVVHPAQGNYTGTIVNALLYKKQPEDSGDPLRPGIIHRLDKDTSGAMVIAWTKKSLTNIADQFKARTVKKKYFALAAGVFKNKSGKIDLPIGRSKFDRKKMSISTDGRSAVTIYKVAEDFEHGALVELDLLTGRTHQIRVHLAHIKHPVVGDAKYGNSSKLIKRQALHCGSLGFAHPVTGKFMVFEAPFPEDFKAALEAMRAGCAAS